MTDPLSSFVAYLEGRGLGNHTVEAYQRDLRSFLEFVDKPAMEVDRNEIRAFMVHRLQHYDPRSVSRGLSAVRHFYRFLLYEGLAQKDPTHKIPLPKTRKILPKALRPAEIDAMADSLDTSPLGLRDRAIVLMGFGAGLRVSELISLKLANLNLEGSFLTVRMGKFSKDRIAPLNPRAIGALRIYLEQGRPKLCRGRETPYVFVGRWGTAPISRQGVFMSIRDLGKQVLGKAISPHWLRHSFGTALVVGGADLRAVQIMMGHTAIDNTQVYIHVDLTALRDAYSTAHPKAKRVA